MRLDEESLAQWGERIGATVGLPVVLGLQGSLGAGKSVLARAIGKGAGVRSAMPSPSFNLVFRYPARLGREVVHLDLFRIESPEALWELGWEQLGADNEIVIVEWPERAGDLMPNDHWLVHLTVVPGHSELRDVAVRRVGAPPELAGFPMSVSGL